MRMYKMPAQESPGQYPSENCVCVSGTTYDDASAYCKTSGTFWAVALPPMSSGWVTFDSRSTGFITISSFHATSAPVILSKSAQKEALEICL